MSESKKKANIIVLLGAGASAYIKTSEDANQGLHRNFLPTMNDIYSDLFGIRYREGLRPDNVKIEDEKKLEWLIQSFKGNSRDNMKKAAKLLLEAIIRQSWFYYLRDGKFFGHRDMLKDSFDKCTIDIIFSVIHFLRKISEEANKKKESLDNYEHLKTKINFFTGDEVDYLMVGTKSIIESIFNDHDFRILYIKDCFGKAKNSTKKIVDHMTLVDESLKLELCKRLARRVSIEQTKPTQKIIDILKMYSAQNGKLKIFTTNYDNVFDSVYDKGNCPAVPECYLTDKDSPLFNNVKTSFPDSNWYDWHELIKWEGNELPFYVFKLHGSFGLLVEPTLDGLLNNNKCVDNCENKCDKSCGFHEKFFLYYPGLPDIVCDSNYKANNFFDSQFIFFEDSIRKADICIVIGFSFGSKRILDIFKKVIHERSSKGAQLKIVIWADESTDMVARRFTRGVEQNILIELIDEPFNEENVDIISHYLNRMIM